MWKDKKTDDRRKRTLLEKIDELERDNADLRRRNEYLQERVDNYESIIGKVKDTEQQYQAAMRDARDISLKYNEAIEEVKAMKEKYEADFGGLIKRMRET